MPLAPETETSDFSAVSEHSVEQQTTLSTETLPKFIPVPGSLQEAFVKRKKSFIERSSQRQKEIRSKIRVSENSQSKIIKGKSSTGMFPKTLVSVSEGESGISYYLFFA